MSNYRKGAQTKNIEQRQELKALYTTQAKSELYKKEEKEEEKINISARERTLTLDEEPKSLRNTDRGQKFSKNKLKILSKYDLMRSNTETGQKNAIPKSNKEYLSGLRVNKKSGKGFSMGLHSKPTSLNDFIRGSKLYTKFDKRKGRTRNGRGIETLNNKKS